MIFGEKKTKVKSIVNGAFDEIDQKYAIETSYLTDLGDSFQIDYNKLIQEYDNLPRALIEYNERVRCNNIGKNINRYLTYRNWIEAWHMMIKAFNTNGVEKSMQYALRKAKKTFEK